MCVEKNYVMFRSQKQKQLLNKNRWSKVLLVWLKYNLLTLLFLWMLFASGVDYSEYYLKLQQQLFSFSPECQNHSICKVYISCMLRLVAYWYLLVNVISLLLSRTDQIKRFPLYYTIHTFDENNICYQLVNVFSLSLSQTDQIKRFPLYYTIHTFDENNIIL